MNIDQYSQIAAWIEALSSCAIEGNETAKDLLTLRETDYVEFIRQCEILFGEERERMK